MRETGKPTMQWSTPSVRQVLASPADAHWFAARTFDGHVLVFDARNRRGDQALYTFGSAEQPIVHMAWGSDRLLYTLT